MFLANNDISKLKIALTVLLTTRGIPKIFYGTEIGIIGDNRHGTIRTPFPGGFKNDNRNAFERYGRTRRENDIFNFTKELISIRKKYKSLSQGNLIHYYPFNNVYVYFRIMNDEKTMIVANANTDQVSIKLSDYKESLADIKSLLNLLTKEHLQVNEKSSINIPGKSAHIFLLKK